jgi:HupE / UreJ protein
VNARACLLCAAVVVASLGSARAAAHDVHGEVLLLDVGEHSVQAELQVPVALLALARHQSVRELSDDLEALRAYLRTHIHASARDGRAFTVELDTPSLQAHGEDMVLLAHLQLQPPTGATARWFELRDDVVLARVVTDNVYVFLRRDLRAAAFGDAPQWLGSLHYQRRSLVIDRTHGSAWSGFAAAVSLGLRHIAEGTDHLLFLCMLLLPAPLMAAARGWGVHATLRHSVRETIKLVTAFTLGHSLTLLLGAAGLARLPSAPLEILVAASILVSAVHALHPIFPGREALVAGAFGLVHGLAFASALTGFGFDGASLALSVFGFNLGVEAMQLAVVLLTMPSLLVLARSASYRWLRVAAASFGAFAACGWIAERAWGVSTPIPAWVDMTAARAPWLAALLALAAVTMLVAPRLRALGHPQRIATQ